MYEIKNIGGKTYNIDLKKDYHKNHSPYDHSLENKKIDDHKKKVSLHIKGLEDKRIKDKIKKPGDYSKLLKAKKLPEKTKSLWIKPGEVINNVSEDMINEKNIVSLKNKGKLIITKIKPKEEKKDVSGTTDGNGNKENKTPVAPKESDSVKNNTADNTEESKKK